MTSAAEPRPGSYEAKLAQNPGVIYGKARAAAEPMVAKCMLCSWTLSATTGECLEAARAHRKEHGFTGTGSQRLFRAAQKQKAAPSPRAERREREERVVFDAVSANPGRTREELVPFCPEMKLASVGTRLAALVGAGKVATRRRGRGSNRPFEYVVAGQ